MFSRFDASEVAWAVVGWAFVLGLVVLNVATHGAVWHILNSTQGQ